MRVAAAVGIAVAGATAGALVVVGLTSLTASSATPEAFGLNEIARNGNVQGELYPGDPTAEAALVTEEDQRVVYVRKVASAAYWSLAVSEPYRFQTGTETTLVLPAREAAYTLDDIRALAPETLVQEQDGMYLLKEDIAVMEGATLDLASAGRLVLKLSSDEQAFTSIIAFGGVLDLSGTTAAPISITSWNSALGTPDVDTTDGRAYIRVIGGSASVASTDMSHLGFWSGSTGGFAVTGNDGLDGAALAEAVTDDAAPLPALAGAPVVDPEGLFSETDPSQPLTEAPDAAADGLAEATIADSRFDGNAFGIFVSSAENVTIADTVVSDSLVDGITFHRQVTGSSIADTTTRGNAVDGISLGRSITGVGLDGVTAAENGRNGISIDGQSLADGPSASGTSVSRYGGISLLDSTVASNGRYGAEISGGTGIRVQQTTFDDNPDGLVLDEGADRVTVSDNVFTGQSGHSVAIRDTVTEATVEGNTIEGGDTGIYIRNATASVEENVLSAVTGHGVTLLGDVAGSDVADNTIGGSGSSAVRATQSEGALIGDNDLGTWRPAATVESVVGFVLQPLTIVWLVLALLLIGTAFTRKGTQYESTESIRHPYAERVPLTSLSRGIVPFESLTGTAEPAAPGAVTR
ncbi:right-handed parallel beta-helix repeat-containing protein [Herbiconiux liukaitaii]|uniref:right-handed parallel beta-helix repeat-containing protein n=1 Tax=Herbiconiux liukaitaii TaxID=3342799 RepID=UPI0035BAB55E